MPIPQTMPGQQQPQMGRQLMPGSIPYYMSQFGQQATQPQQLPQGYREAAASAQLGLLGELGDPGQFQRYVDRSVQNFQDNTIPRLLQQMGGRNAGTFNQALQNATRGLASELGTQEMGFQQNRQGMLGNLNNQNQMFGQRQQEIGLQGLQSQQNALNQFGQLLSLTPLQRLQALQNAGAQQTQTGLGQGGDTMIDQGALTQLAQLFASGIGAYTGGGR